MTETEVQKQIIEWCGYALKSNVVYWSTPNEREPKRLGNLRSMGLKTGVSDLMFLHGGDMLFVEVKRPTTFKKGGGSTYYVVDNLPDFQQIMQNWGWAR